MLKYFFYLYVITICFRINAQTTAINGCNYHTNPCLNSISRCDTLILNVQDGGEWIYYSGIYSDTTATGNIDTTTFITPNASMCGYPCSLWYYDVSSYSRLFVYEDNSFNHNIINIISVIPCITTDIQNDNMPQSNFRLYPNPANKILRIESEIQFGELKITGTLGNEIKSQWFSGKSSIDISDLPDGIYFATLKTSSTYYTKKIIVHK